MYYLHVIYVVISCCNFDWPIYKSVMQTRKSHGSITNPSIRIRAILGTNVAASAPPVLGNMDCDIMPTKMQMIAVSMITMIVC
jgi:hypothetical protein